MASHNSEKVRLIFGMKLRQLRQEKGILLTELAEKAGLSVSYLNEIEKGKKYPKADKILALADALGSDYDALVSMKLSKPLEPIAELFNSNILQEIPFELFGIEPSDLLELLAQAPARTSAFISTLIEICRNYGMRVEQFYFSALRSYRELQNNHFEDLEITAERFLAETKAPLSEVTLELLLTETYRYQVTYFTEKSHPDLRTIRSVFRPETRTLLVNETLTPAQRAFTFGREIGYQVLAIKDRPHVSSVPEAESFEQVLNNYRASYFAGAILMPRRELIPALDAFFSLETWQPDALKALIGRFHATPEMFLQRASNLLSGHFGISQSFFLRFDHLAGDTSFHLSKELYLTSLHTPNAALNERYCRRWVALTILQELAALQQAGTWDGDPLCRAQVSEYADTGTRFLVLSIARPSPPTPGKNSSLSLGMAVDENLISRIRFLKDVPARLVGETCERCAVAPCAERAAEPVVLRKKEQLDRIREAVRRL